jgi:hypothetical protein
MNEKFNGRVRGYRDLVDTEKFLEKIPNNEFHAIYAVTENPEIPEAAPIAYVILPVEKP